jgi:hypothetical protein
VAEATWQRHSVGMSRARSRRHRSGWCGTNRWRARLAPALEGLDDHHAPAAARTGQSWIGCFNRLSRLGWQRHREQLLDAGDIGLAGGTGEQATVPNAVEALRQDVQQEAPDALLGGERHRAIALGTVAATILVAEGHAVFVERDQPAVGDGDPVRVARQIGKHRLWPGKGWLGVDHPVLLSQRCDEAQEGALFARPGVVAEEVEPARGMNLKQPCQEQAAEKFG